MNNGISIDVFCSNFIHTTTSKCGIRQDKALSIVVAVFAVIGAVKTILKCISYTSCIAKKMIWKLKGDLFRYNQTINN